MPNYSIIKSRAVLGIIFSILSLISGLASCGGKVDTPVPKSAPLGNTDASIPTVTLVAASNSIAYHDSTSLSWTSTNSARCVSSGGGGTRTSGTFNTGALSATTTYTVTCISADGSRQGSDSKTITVVPSPITQFSDAGSGNVTVTSINFLINGAYITIFGTANYNGTYSVANVTSSSFTIVHAFAGDDAIGTWKPAGGMNPDCSTEGHTAAIVLPNNFPSRFTGVAPLFVFFDASGTTVTDANKSHFRDLEYKWTFEGSPGQNWTYGSTKGSRNMATGPVAAHLFETPGLYTVVLTATDGTNTVTNSCAQIVVEDTDAYFAGAKTVCVSNAGDFTGCPTGATHAANTSDFPTALANISSGAKRLLFKADDTWTTTTVSNISTVGPGYIGKYGTGAAPKVRVLNDLEYGLITFSGADWRFADFELDGQNHLNVRAVTPIADQITLLRLNIHNVCYALITTALPWSDQFSISDSVVTSIHGGVATNGDNVAFMMLQRSSFQGNSFDAGRGGEHILRLPKLSGGVIANNDLKSPAAEKGIIKLHSASANNAMTWDGTYSENVVISDNSFSDPAGVTVGLAPQNAQRDERVRNVLVERNWFKASERTQYHMHVDGVDITIRNNIFDLNGAAYNTAIRIERQAPTPVTDNIAVYNNTIYAPVGAYSYAYVLDICALCNSTQNEAVTNVQVKNNLFSAPGVVHVQLIAGAGGTGTVTANNIINNTPSALFVSGTPTIPADFMLTTLPNPARDTGTTIPVWSDFSGPFLPNGTTRPQNGNFDVGAFEGN